jgi:class 3 adenylate cyclase
VPNDRHDLSSRELNNLRASAAGLKAFIPYHVVRCSHFRKDPDAELVGHHSGSPMRDLLSDTGASRSFGIQFVVYQSLQQWLRPNHMENSRTDIERKLARLELELSQALEQQSATSEILRVISASRADARAVFETIVRNTVLLCGSLFANVFRFDGEVLHFITSHNVGPDYVDLLKATYPMRPDNSQVAGRVIRARSVVKLEDALVDPKYDQRFPAAMGWRRMLGVPMLCDGDPIGVIVAGWAEPGPVPKTQENLLKTFADQAVIAIENARLFSELEVRNREILSRYFSPSLAQRLAGGIDEIELTGRRREVAALFTDIEGFTSLVETMEPGLLSELLNGYLAGMTSVVFAHEGTVAKVVGDALQVLFGAPGDQPDHAARAVACALDLDIFAQSFRETWRQKGTALGPTRIGVNAGSAIVGNFGGGRFFDYTAYGDTINIAARLEAANKQLGTRICVSGSVARQVRDFRGRPVGDLVLRGRSEPLRAFEPLPPEQFGDPSTEAYLKAFTKLESADPEALGAFAAAVSRTQGDRLASFHLKRLLNGAMGTRIEMD